MEINNIHSQQGAYDEAIEASAECLLKVSRNGRTTEDTNAKMPDNGDFRVQQVDSSSVISSTSSTSEFASDSSETQDIESEISFLHEKQNLLKRAISALKREDTYEAAKARSTIQAVPECCRSPLWNEAREVLDFLNRDVSEKSAEHNIDVTNDRSPMLQSGKPLPVKRQKIDTSSVSVLSARGIGSDTGNLLGSNEPCLSFPMATNGSWMARALTRSAVDVNPGINQPTTSSSNAWWQVMNDPGLGLLAVPPAFQTICDGIELKDALMLTSEPRLVAMSTPPFYAVYANKAFCELALLRGGDVVGKPIESLIQQQHWGNTVKSIFPVAGPLTGILVATRKPCRLDLIPVRDKFKNPSGGLSHILLKVQAGSGLPGLVEREEFDAVGTSSAHTSKNAFMHDPQERVFGAVG